MNMRILTVVALTLPASAYATTKNLECALTTDQGVTQTIKATLDDTSDKAEVQVFSTSADCARNDSCEIDIYKKDILPSVVRLSHTQGDKTLSFSTTIDINRTTLDVVTRMHLTGLGLDSEATGHGKCEIKVIDSKKVL